MKIPMKIPMRDAVIRAIHAATRAGTRSPCEKSKRGVVCFDAGGEIVSEGWNRPPHGMVCDGSPACRASCGKTCLHAEHIALRNLGDDPRPVHLLHIKVEDGVAVPSGPPSCWQCSREILDDARVSLVFLLHDSGWRQYNTDEFHRLTLEHCGLHPAGELKAARAELDRLPVELERARGDLSAWQVWAERNLPDLDPEDWTSSDDLRRKIDQALDAGSAAAAELLRTRADADRLRGQVSYLKSMRFVRVESAEARAETAIAEASAEIADLRRQLEAARAAGLHPGGLVVGPHRDLSAPTQPEVIALGVRVRTLTDAGATDWTEGSRAPKWGVTGRVVDVIGGHGRCFLVLHDDLSKSWYGEVEVEAVPELEENTIMAVTASLVDGVPASLPRATAWASFGTRRPGPDFGPTVWSAGGDVSCSDA